MKLNTIKALYSNKNLHFDGLKSYSKYKSLNSDKEKLENKQFEIFKALNKIQDIVVDKYVNKYTTKLMEKNNEFYKLNAEQGELIADMIQGKAPKSEYNEIQDQIYGENGLGNVENKLDENFSDKEALRKKLEDPENTIIDSFQQRFFPGEPSGFNAASGFFLEPNLDQSLVNYHDMYASLDLNEVIDFYSDYLTEEELDNAFKDIEDPDVSKEFASYALTGENPLIVMRSIKDDPKTDLEKQESSLFERDGKMLKEMLGESTKNDVDYEKKISDIALYMSSPDNASKFGLTSSKFNKDERENPSKYVDYMEELIIKSKAFEQDYQEYTNGVDFEKIGKDAVDNAKSLDPKDIAKSFRSHKSSGKKYQDDKELISTYFEKCETNKDYSKAYNKLLDDVINKKCDLYKFADKDLSFNSKDISEVSSFINRAFKDNMKVDLDSFGVKLLKENASHIDQYAEMKSIESQFNGMVNIPMNSEEKDLSNQAKGMIKANKATFDELNINSRVAYQKSKGLDCDKDSPMLNDAIKLYQMAKDVRDARPWYYGLIHPINNYLESSALDLMKTTLKNNYGFSDRELDERVNAVRTNGDHLSPTQKLQQQLTDPAAYKESIKKENNRINERKAFIDNKLDIAAKKNVAVNQEISDNKEEVNKEIINNELNNVRVKDENLINDIKNEIDGNVQSKNQIINDEPSIQENIIEKNQLV